MTDQSPRMEWPYPSASDDPWLDAFRSFVSAQDFSGFASREDRNILMGEGGIVTWTLGSETLAWDDEIFLTSPQTGFSWRVQASSLVITDGQVLYVTLSRNPLSNIALTPTAVSTTPNTDDAYVIAVRIGSRIYWRNGTVMTNGDSFSGVGSSQGIAGGATLQSAYDANEILGLTDARGPFEINDLAQTSGTNSLEIAKTYAGGGNALDVSMGASTTGHGIYVATVGGSTGNGLDVSISGTGRGLSVTMVGAGTGIYVDAPTGSGISVDDGTVAPVLFTATLLEPQQDYVIDPLTPTVVNTDGLTVTVRGGDGGPGSGGLISGDGADLVLVGGIPGADGGAGSGIYGDIMFQAQGGTPIPFSEIGDIALDVGFSAGSVIGALNELLAGSGGTLQESYALGNVIVATAARAIAFSNAVDATDLLTLDRTFAGAGDALSVTMGASATGAALQVASTSANSILGVTGSTTAYTFDHDGADYYTATANGGVGITASGMNFITGDSGDGESGSDGGPFSVTTGAGGTATTGTGGVGGPSTWTTGDGGAESGSAGTAGAGGSFSMILGDGGVASYVGFATGGKGGSFSVTTGAGGVADGGGGASGVGGDIDFIAGPGGATGAFGAGPVGGGSFSVTAGDGGLANGTGGAITLLAGTSTSGTLGSVNINTVAGTGGAVNIGNSTDQPTLTLTGRLSLQYTAAVASTALVINRSPTGPAGGSGIDLTMGANSTGLYGITVAQAGSGVGLNVNTSGSNTAVVAEFVGAGTAAPADSVVRVAGTSESDTTANYSVSMELESTGTGAESVSVLVGDADPNGDVTSGDVGSLLLDGAAGVAYIKTAGPSTWASLATGGVALAAMPDGLEATPGWAYASDATTGFWYSATGVLNISTSGALALRVNDQNPTSAAATIFPFVDLTFDASALSGASTGWSALTVNVTDGAGTGTKKLLDLQLGGSPVAYVDDSGTLFSDNWEALTTAGGIQARGVVTSGTAPAVWLTNANAYSRAGAGKQTAVSISGTLLQTAAADVAFTALDINITETTVGLGDQRLIDMRIGGTSVAYIDNTGHYFGAQGPVGQPVYSFVADPDTGIYQSGLGSVNCAINGVDRFSVRNTFIVLGTIQTRAEDGSSAAPQYSFTSDTTAGMYMLSGVIGLSTSSQTALSIDDQNPTSAAATVFPLVDVIFNAVGLTGDAGWSALTIDVADGAGTGAKKLLDLQVDSSPVAYVDSAGAVWQTGGVYQIAADFGVALWGNQSASASSAGISLLNQNNFGASAGQQVGVSIAHTITQTGTAGMESLKILRTNTGVATTGDQLYIHFTNGGNSQTKIDYRGNTWLNSTQTHATADEYALDVVAGHNKAAGAVGLIRGHLSKGGGSATGELLLELLYDSASKARITSAGNLYLDGSLFADTSTGGMSIFGAISTSAGSATTLGNSGSLTASTAVIQNVTEIAATIAQTSTAGYNALLVKMTETTTGSGVNNFMLFQGGSSPADVAYLANDGKWGAALGAKATPTYHFIGRPDVGTFSPAANQLGLAANSEYLIVDNDSSVPSFRPDVDNTWSLGEDGLRFTTLWSAAVNTGDIFMESQNPGDDALWVLVEDRGGLYARDLRTNKAYKFNLTEIPVDTAPRTIGEREAMKAAA